MHRCLVMVVGAALALAACVSSPALPAGAPQAAASPGVPHVAETPSKAADAARVMQATCGANPQNAEREINFVCSLQSSDLAHLEAGRAPPPKLGCPPAVACDIEDASLVVRILFSPATMGMDNVPRATSLEITGFDKPTARASARPLEGLAPWRPMTDAPTTPPLMQRAKGGAEFDLTPEATRRILDLASALRRQPETATWLLCRIDAGAGKDALPAVVFSNDPAGAFIELFFGAETHAYLRNGAYYGKAGRIAALASGSDRPETRCRPPPND